MNEATKCPVPNVTTTDKNYFPRVIFGKLKIDVNSFIKAHKKRNAVKCTKHDKERLSVMFKDGNRRTREMSD